VHTILGDKMSIYVQLLLASFFWGSNVIVMKLLLHEIPFLLLATMRVFLSFVFLGGYLAWKKISFQYDYQKKALIIGILAIYLNFFFTFLGMNEVKGIDNAFMNALAPILTFVFSILLLKQKGSQKEYIAIGLTVFAFLLSIRFQIFSIKIGFWYLFIGMLLYMLANVFIQKWNLHNCLTLSFYELLYGFIFLSIHCYYKGQLHFEPLLQISLFHWLLFIIISGIGFAYIQVIYMKSIGTIGALKTSFFLSLNPIITYFESLFFLNEKFDWLHFIGFILLALAIYMIKGQKEKGTTLFHNNE
jgi:drug/metabolite transporter (DMT)-like permease